VTDRGEDYVNFTAVTDPTALVTVEPNGTGCAVIDDLNGNTALAIGDTPSEQRGGRCLISAHLRLVLAP
jgi:hypothetical protein